MAARGFAAEMEREKAKQRTRDALLARAKRGHVTGGVVYGYRNVPVFTGSDASGNPIRSHVRQTIADGEARVVRGIYQMFADGHGLKSIAKALNGDGKLQAESDRYFGGARVSPPRKGSGSWAPSCVHAMLKRERYRGKLTWGAFRNTDRGGRTKRRVKQPEDSWVTVEAPDLRIVSEELWHSVEARRQENAHRFTQPTDGTSSAPSSRVSQSLLSGLASCTACGGPIIISGSRKRAQCYGCGYYRNRRPTVCANQLLESIAAVDRRLIREIECTVLTPEARRFTLERAAEIVHDRLRSEPDRLTSLATELAQAKREVENLLRAIESGGAPETLLDRLREKTERVKSLTAEMRAIQSATRISPRNLRQIDRLLEESLKRTGDLLLGDVVRARQALTKLLAGRVQFTPTALADGRGTYRLEAELTLGKMLSPEASSKVHVPDGI